MAGGLLLSLVIALIIISIILLLMLCVKQPQAAKLRADNFSIEGLTHSDILKKIIDAAMPKETEKEYRTCERLIGDSGFNIGMRVVYFYKLTIPIVLLILLFSIYLINKNLVIDEIISGGNEKVVDVMGTVSNQNKAKKTQSEQERAKASRDTYLVMEHLVNTRILKSKDAVSAKLALQEAIVENKVEIEGSVENAVNDFYNKWTQVQEAKEVNFLTILFIFILAIFGFWVPDAVMKTSRFLRYQSFDNEVIALEMLTILVGSIENITVKEILKILEKNSKVFKKNFEKALLEYPIDFEQALINLENSSKNKDFQTLISTLRQCATSDKYAALQTLQRRRISRKEYRKLMEEKKIETKTFVGLICLVPPLFFLAKLLLAPWLQDIYGSGLL